MELAKSGRSPLVGFQRVVKAAGRLHYLPKLVLCGEVRGRHALRIGIFGGIDAGSLDTVKAVAEVVKRYEASLGNAYDYILAAYPKTNVEAFAAKAKGYPEFQQRTARFPNEEDARFFREELKTSRFSMILRLHSDGAATGFYAKAAGELIARSVVAPALNALRSTAPLAEQPVELLPRHRLSQLTSTSQSCITPAETRGGAIEVELYSPGNLGEEARVEGLAFVVGRILENYRTFLSFQALL